MATNRNWVTVIKVEVTRNAWGQVISITKTFSNGKKVTK